MALKKFRFTLLRKGKATKMNVPVASREFTTAECYTNVVSFGKDGHGETVRQNREVCPIHLDIVSGYVLSSS